MPLIRLATSALVGYLCIALLVIGSVGALPASAWASFVQSEAAVVAPGLDRAADLARLKPVLEYRLVAQRLADFGLAPGEISSRLAQLSDAQVHQIVQQIDSLQPGGDSGLGIIIALLVIAILVVVLLQITGHRVIVTK